MKQRKFQQKKNDISVAQSETTIIKKVRWKKFSLMYYQLYVRSNIRVIVAGGFEILRKFQLHQCSEIDQGIKSQVKVWIFNNVNERKFTYFNNSFQNLWTKEKVKSYRSMKIHIIKYLKQITYSNQLYFQRNEFVGVLYCTNCQFYIEPILYILSFIKTTYYFLMSFFLKKHHIIVLLNLKF